MTTSPWFRPPRRLLAAFLVLTCLLAAGLAWLGWQVVDLDRRLERQRTQERLGYALDLAALSLRNWLADLDRRLSEVVATANTREGLADSIPVLADLGTVVTITPTGVRVLPAGSLAFYPEPAGDAPGWTTTGLGTTGRAPADSTVARRALVLLEQGAAFRSQGQLDRALAAYQQLSTVPVVIPGLDAPADIVALHARGLALASAGRADALRHEAAALRDAVRDPARRLSRRVYSYYAAEAQQWLDPAGTSIAPETSVREREARATVIADLVDGWRNDGPATSPLSGPRIIRTGDDNYFVLTRAATQSLAVLVATSAALDTRIEELIATTSPGVALSIAGADGAIIAGRQPADATLDRVVRTPAESRLPWTLVAAPGPGWAADATASERQRLVMIAVLLVGVAVLAGAWITGRAMHRELEAARLQSEFVAAVSHEFRTPLAAFGQLTELLADGRVASDADREEYYRRLQHETGRLQRLVDDLLDFRRMEAGAREYEFAEVDAVALLGRVVADCRATDGSAPRLELVTPDRPVPIRADREAFARAVRNLIENARKYAPGTPVVEVRLEDTTESVSIAVADTGPGVAPEVRAAIFEKFVRAVGAGGGVRGTGLGLAMVRHIVRAHGGTVRLDSDVGRGSTFTIAIPPAGAGRAATSEA